MHPYIRSSKHFLMIFLLWAPTCIYFIKFASKMADISLIDAIILAGPPLCILPFIALSNWYLCKNNSFDELKFINFVFIHIIYVLVSIGVWIIISFLYTFFLDYFLMVELWQKRFISIIPFLIVLGGGVYFLAVFFNYLLIAMEKNKELEQKALENSLANSQSAYKALRATIHPHFLFNSLNALSVLTLSAPETANKISLQLSDFMRYSLRYQKKEIVKVQEEVNHIKNYLGIEKIRLGKRLNLQFEIDESVMDIPILSFILLPLVENSIKHGIQELIEGGTLTVIIKKVKDNLYIEVKNPYEENHRSLKGEGIGLPTLKKRLQLTYGENGHILVKKDEKFYKVIIKIPVE